MSATIFVSIANYRDPQVKPTVDDLLAKAKYPERIRVGVFSQIDVLNENLLSDYSLPQIRQQIVPYTQSFGVCWARARILDYLLGDEDFVLQIDSHSRFDQNWDESVISMFEELGDPKAVFTHYPVDFRPEQPLPEQRYTYHCIGKFNDNGLPVISSGSKKLEDAPKSPMPNAVIAGGSLFTRASTLRHVRYDPYLYFSGEEISMALRLFTHGYNLYTPHKPFMYHQYAIVKTDRTKHWEDNRGWVMLNQKAMKRLKHLLGIELSDDATALQDWDMYRLGTERTLAQWEAFAGVCIRDKTTTVRSEKGQFGLSE